MYFHTPLFQYDGIITGNVKETRDKRENKKGNMTRFAKELGSPGCVNGWRCFAECATGRLEGPAVRWTAERWRYFASHRLRCRAPRSPVCVRPRFHWSIV